MRKHDNFTFLHHRSEMTGLCYKLFGGEHTFIYAEAGHTAMRRRAMKKDLVPNDARSHRARFRSIQGLTLKLPSNHDDYACLKSIVRLAKYSTSSGQLIASRPLDEYSYISKSSYLPSPTSQR
jgi:hypothetical protein